MATENLFPQQDLNDPETLIAACESLSGGMAQQANAARTGSGAAGHPFPDQFYDQVAAALRAAGTKLRGCFPKTSDTAITVPGGETGATPPVGAGTPADGAQGPKKGK